MPERNSVWLRPTKNARSQPALDRDQIVAAAVALLDEETVAGLTMRKLAARLDAAPMTLYGYVATKDDLLEFAVDAVFAEALEDAEPSGEWVADLTAIGRRTFQALMRHPWAAALVGDNPPMGPAAVAHFATILRVLTDAGFSDDELGAATAGYYYYVLGAALAESAWARVGESANSWSPEDLSQLTSADGRDVTPTVRFLGRFAHTDSSQRFEQGLHCLLNGLHRA
ncbi:TetR/AcrR family transcriptional regulator [Nocardia sp. NBC_01730]|uniref:TetR/AcrR family transcriptional regulator n=1 Tax=Nocardia sp. NBC_01730 TaxID=2975998 RepID=UPI002E0F758E|nr:TetR/AcrR family transcriptional regulator [Nocardia sp. NBC_01730]